MWARGSAVFFIALMPWCLSYVCPSREVVQLPSVHTSTVPTSLLFDLPMLCELLVSWCCSRQPTKRAPRPVEISVPLGGAGASSPQRQEAFPYQCDREQRESATTKKSAACLNPKPDWKIKREEIIKSAHDLEKDTVPCTGRSLISRDLPPLATTNKTPMLRVKPLLHRMDTWSLTTPLLSSGNS